MRSPSSTSATASTRPIRRNEKTYDRQIPDRSAVELGVTALKGWLDRVWATDVAFKFPSDGGRIVSLVPHIGRIGVVTTCGAPWWISVLMGQPGRKTILRGLRALCAPRSRTLFLAHYDMDRSTPQTRAAFLAKVRRKVAAF